MVCTGRVRSTSGTCRSSIWARNARCGRGRSSKPMIASNVTADVLDTAARAIGVRVHITTINQNGTRHRGKVYPDAWQTPEEALTPKGNRRRDSRGNKRYQRISAGWQREGRRVAAVCWHGFRDYFREVFKVAPGAVFRTAVD